MSVGPGGVAGGVLALVAIFIRSKGDMALALAAFGLLMFWRWSPLYVVVTTAIGSAVMALV